MAGFKELLAVEWDKNAVKVFKLNFPKVNLFHGDIAKLSVKSCLEMTGLKEGELDIFDGSPPCQGFSTAGQRISNGLFLKYEEALVTISKLKDEAIINKDGWREATNKRLLKKLELIEDFVRTFDKPDDTAVKLILTIIDS